MSASKAKGTAWETRLVRWLRAHGWPNAGRQPNRGVRDCGDVQGILDGDVVIEAKDCVQLDLRKWCDEAERERVEADALYAFVALKRSGTTDAGDSYAIMRTRDMNRLLLELHGLRQEVRDLAGGLT